MTTVLIVDDHPEFRAAARALLEADGFTVLGEAADGESAIGAAAILDPELVLLDVQLPDIDGFAVAERLMNGPQPHPAVVLISTPGGQSPMFTFESATNLQIKFREFFEAGKISAALCHGVAILRFTTLSDGSPLVAGRTVTGFANVEENFSDNAVWELGMLARDKHVMPWRIEDALRELGANYIQGGLWKGFAVRDGNLVTGQQNFSGGETADLVIEALGR